ncbi:MAG: hypothetical protein AAGI88_10305 [Pseudomonadota bacterium]
MATRSNTLLFVGLVIIGLMVGVLYFVSSNLNGLVASVIEEQGSAATGTSVKVDEVDIRLVDSAAAFTGLRVANPDGFSGNAIELGGFAVNLDPSSVTSDTLIIHEIVVDSARINVLQEGTRNNLRELLKSLQAGAAEDDESQDASGGKKLIIERFSLLGASASVSLADLDKQQEVNLPDVVLTDIGKADGGATGAQVAQQILKPVLESAMSSATAGALKQQVGEKVNEAVGGFLKGLGKKKDNE